jgi:hypothetical protein
VTHRDDIVAAMAKYAYASAWADAYEEKGGKLSGVEIMDVAPPPTSEAKAWAEKTAKDIERLNEASLEELLAKAMETGGATGDVTEDLLGDFGYVLALRSMGHGVDFHYKLDLPDLKLPHTEFYVDSEDVTVEERTATREDDPDFDADGYAAAQDAYHGKDVPDEEYDLERDAAGRFQRYYGDRHDSARKMAAFTKGFMRGAEQSKLDKEESLGERTAPYTGPRHLSPSGRKAWSALRAKYPDAYTGQEGWAGPGWEELTRAEKDLLDKEDARSEMGERSAAHNPYGYETLYPGDRVRHGKGTGGDEGSVLKTTPGRGGVGYYTVTVKFDDGSERIVSGDDVVKIENTIGERTADPVFPKVGDEFETEEGTLEVTKVGQDGSVTYFIRRGADSDGPYTDSPDEWAQWMAKDEARTSTKSLSPKERIAKFREIVGRHQHAKIDGAGIDAFSASAVTQVYDKLSDTNKARYAAMPAAQMVNMAYKMMAKGRGEASVVEVPLSTDEAFLAERRAPSSKEEPFGGWEALAKVTAHWNATVEIPLGARPGEPYKVVFRRGADAAPFVDALKGIGVGAEERFSTMAGADGKLIEVSRDDADAKAREIAALRPSRA